jgi:membrane protease YdiL (CAAX protease family)
MNTTAIVSAVKRIGLALLASLAVASLGSLTWVPLVIANSRFLRGIPWSVVVEGVVLFLVWKYLGGSGRPRRTASARRELLRSQIVPGRQFVWAAIAGGLSLVALAGLWIVLVRLTGVGGNPTLPYLSGYSPIVVVLVIGMASLVSPLTEEAAFRGYAQVLLERRFLPVFAVGISSVLFALYHGPTQGFAPSKLAFYLIVGIVFGTIAFMTCSTLPALPVHIAGDLLFFLVIWPGDAGRSVVWSHGADLMFWANVLQVLVFGTLAVLAFLRLKATRSSARRGQPTPASPPDLGVPLMISPQRFKAHSS